MALPTTRASTTVDTHGPALRVIRQALGVTIEDVAEGMQCDRSTISKLETGANRRCSAAFFTRLCSVLGVTDHRALMAHPYGLSGLDRSAYEDGDGIDTAALPRPDTTAGVEPVTAEPALLVPAQRGRHRRGATR